MTEKKKSNGGILGFIKKIIEFFLGRKSNKKK